MVQCNDGIHEMRVGDFEQCPHRFPEVDIRYGSGVSTELCEEHAAEAAEDADYEAAGEEAQRWQNAAARSLTEEFWDDDVEASDEDVEREISEHDNDGVEMEVVDGGDHTSQEPEDDDLSSPGFVPAM